MVLFERLISIFKRADWNRPFTGSFQFTEQFSIEIARSRGTKLLPQNHKGAIVNEYK